VTRAIHYRDRNQFLADQVPGSFWVAPPDDDGTQVWLHFCPCGCGAKHRLRVGNGFKPSHGPSWCWNGSTTAPELSPSINWEGHWHGWLRAGEWRAC